MKYCVAFLSVILPEQKEKEKMTLHNQVLNFGTSELQLFSTYKLVNAANIEANIYETINFNLKYY